MKKNAIISVLIFLLLSAITVQAQNSQTSVKKVITDHSEQADKIVGKKIDQHTLSGSHFEKLDTIIAVKPKPHNKKITHKKGKSNVEVAKKRANRPLSIYQILP